MSSLHPRLPGARVLDLFAGSGALGLECLSRGAAHVTFVERARPVVETIRRNLLALGLGPGDTGPLHALVPGDAFTFVASRSPGDFDLVLADPPYGDGSAERLANAFIRAPFARELWIEHGRRDPLPELAEGSASPVTLRSRRYGDTVLTTLLASP